MATGLIRNDQVGPAAPKLPAALLIKYRSKGGYTRLYSCKAVPAFLSLSRHTHTQFPRSAGAKSIPAFSSLQNVC